MSLHFGTNQYEDAFRPPRLCNYEVPRIHREWPIYRGGGTQAISDEKGYLFKRPPIDRDAPKSDIKCAWDPIHQPPGIVKGVPIKSGIWTVEGRRARWDETGLNLPYDKIKDIFGYSEDDFRLHSDSKESIQATIATSVDHPEETYSVADDDNACLCCEEGVNQCQTQQ